ncbi:MAG: inositol monophosphatase [Proteobacteria bacterium]|nr:inositol monophosphatase [Pseudomonadota bacterium]
MTQSDDARLRYLAAQAVAREAGKLALRHFRARDRLAIEHKGVQDLVSDADREVEDLIGGSLGAAFPGDSFFGEERGAGPHPLRADRLWVIDPIDGTANFLRGLPQWAVSIAFVLGGEVEIGVIYDPVADELFAARRGGGAVRDGAPIRVSGCADLTRATVGIGFSYRRPAAAHVAAVSASLHGHCEYRRTGAGALGIAQVADGRVDAYWEAHMNAWDALAGVILVREAGGWTNDFLAGDGLAAGNAVLACTPALKDPLMATLGLPSSAPQS